MSENKSQILNRNQSQNHSQSEPKLISEICPDCGKIINVSEADIIADEVPMSECQFDCGNMAQISENALQSGAAEGCGNCNGGGGNDECEKKGERIMTDRVELEFQKLKTKIDSQHGQDMYFYNRDGSQRYVGKSGAHREVFPDRLEMSLADDAPMLQYLLIDDDDHCLWELAYWAEIELDRPTFRIGNVDYYNEVMALKYVGISSWGALFPSIYNHLTLR